VSFGLTPVDLLARQLGVSASLQRLSSGSRFTPDLPASILAPA